MELLSTAIAIYATAELLPGFEVKGTWGPLIAAGILGLLQFFLAGLLFALLAIGTLGIGLILFPLTKLVVTTLLLMLADKMLTSLKIDSFGVAIIGALMITVLGSGIQFVFRLVL